jgi:hypothetical protein
MELSREKREMFGFFFFATLMCRMTKERMQWVEPLNNKTAKVCNVRTFSGEANNSPRRSCFQIDEKDD